ncbi:MAG TPA: hypothetical protein VIF43_00730 [Patescibacteria group bacterium]|jgi:hypothetical protein
MESETLQSDSAVVVDGARDGLARQVWETARSAWAESPKGGKDEALESALRTCAEAYPELLPGVFQRGIDSSRPAPEQRAFAGQLVRLAEHDPGQAADIYRELVKRTDRKPGVVTAALGAVEMMRERDPDTFALLIAETKVVLGVESAEWKKARSLLFDGSHSGYAAHNVIEPALRSENEVVRRMTARHLLPELTTKAQYGREILDMIEDRLGQDDDSLTVRACVAHLPEVYDRRPGQARRIAESAYGHSIAVRETVVRAMTEAGMADKLPIGQGFSEDLRLV